MTPVQLPEVPAHSYGFDPNQRESEDAFRWRVTPSHPEPLYTAAQLREYATEAVMAERRRVRAGVQAAVDSIAVPKMTPARAEYWKAGVRYAIRAFNSAITPSETNSDPDAS